MKYRRAVPALAGLLLFLIPAGLLAQQSDEEPGEEARQEMLDLSNEAADAVAREEFQIGAVKFRQAYERYPDPVLLNNEMIAWYRADDCRNALVPARTYLQEYDQEGDDVAPEDRENIRTVMVDCHLELAEEALDQDNHVLANYHLGMLDRADTEPEADNRERYQSLLEAVEQRSAAVEQKQSAEKSDGPEAPPRPSSGSSFHLGWAQIAGGIAAAGVGLSMHTVALSRQSHLRELSTSDPERFEALRDDWSGYQNTARWAVPALYVVGGAAIGSGTFFLLRDSGGSDGVAVTPAVTPDETGFSVSGRF